jgi:hypothetical protein
MTLSALTVEIVPIRTDEDRLLFGMWLRNINRMVIEIVLELRGWSKGEIDEYMGNSWIDSDRNGNPGADDLGRPQFSGGTS